MVELLQDLGRACAGGSQLSTNSQAAGTHDRQAGGAGCHEGEYKCRAGEGHDASCKTMFCKELLASEISAERSVTEMFELV